MSVTGQRIDLGPLTTRGQASFARRARWGVPEIAFWLITVASVFLLPSKSEAMNGPVMLEVPPTVTTIRK